MKSICFIFVLLLASLFSLPTAGESEFYTDTANNRVDAGVALEPNVSYFSPYRIAE